MRVYVVRDSIDNEWDVIYAGSKASVATDLIEDKIDRQIEVWVSGKRVARVGVYVENGEEYLYHNYANTTFKYTPNTLYAFIVTTKEGENI